MLINDWLSKDLRSKEWRSKQWKRVGWAAAVGVSVGIVAATLSVHRPGTEAAPTPYIVPVTATPVSFSGTRELPGVSSARIDMPEARVDEGQLERLKTRNRRLEALVTVLRRRAAERQTE